MSRRHSSILSQLNVQTSLKLALITTSLLVIFGFGFEATVAAAAAATHDEKCKIGLTADNRTLDTCATEKFLTCQNSRCACADISQIWVITRITISSGFSRWKRSPSKGFKAPKGKGFKPKEPVIISPVIIPVLPPVRPRTTRQAPQSFEMFNACYSRVGGTCLLDSSNYLDSVIRIALKRLPESVPTPAAQEATPKTTPKIIIQITTEQNALEIQIPAESSAGTTTTLAADINVEPQGVPEIEGATQLSTNSTPPESSIAGIGRENLNSTERNNSAVNSNGTQTMNSRTKNNTLSNIQTSRLSIPSCVLFAACRPREVKIENGKVIVDPIDPKDDRIGVCQCIDGYVKDESGLCVEKVTERTSGGNVLNVAYVLISACLFLAPLHCA